LKRPPLIFGRADNGRGYVSPALLALRQLGRGGAAGTAAAAAGDPLAKLSKSSSSAAAFPGSIKTRVLDMTVSRVDELLDVGGDVVWYFDADSSNFVVGVRINDQSDVVPMRPGNAIGGFGFTRLLLSNDAYNSGTATLLIFKRSAGNDLAVLNTSPVLSGG
jgi:hypothetical protein